MNTPTKYVMPEMEEGRMLFKTFIENTNQLITKLKKTNEELIEIEIGEYADGTEANCKKCARHTYLNEKFEEYCKFCKEKENELWIAH